jgi:hypothetical protein
VKFLSKLIDDDIKDLAIKINYLLINSQEYKEYHAFNQAIETNLQLDETQLSLLKQEIVNKSYLDSSDLEEIKNKYLNQLQQFLDNDFVKAYRNAYQAYQSIILKVKEDIEELISL